MNYCMHCMQPIRETGKECPFCGQLIQVEYSPHHVIPGTILNRRYLVGKVIGQGGFGITYIGRDLTLDVKIALKEYYPNGYVSRSNTVSMEVSCNASDSDRGVYEKGKERFLDEAKILAKFRNERGVVAVSDFFEENSTAYIVMEYLEGVDLKEILKSKGTISTEQMIEMMLPVIKTLEKIHGQGLIHRDISPDNIRIVEDGLKLMDFGAARVISSSEKKSLSVMLKPGYAPYEQYYSNGKQGCWTDVYSLCATMYKCITGITPDEAPARIVGDTVRPPSELGINISPVIERALMKGLSVKTDDRYQSMDALIRGLSGIGDTSFEEVTVLLPSTRKTTVSENIEFSDENVLEREDKREEISIEASVGFAEQAKTKKKKGKKKDTVKKDKNKRKHRKKFLALLVGVIVLFVGAVIMYVVSRYDDGTTKNTGNVTSSPTPKTESKIYLQGDLFDFKFLLDNLQYQLPISYQSFSNAGWTISGDVNETDVISSHTSVSVKLKRGNSKITVDIVNAGEEEKALQDCQIYGVRIYESDVQNFSMVKGVNFGDSKYRIKNIYGTPDTDDDALFSYKNEHGQEIKFTCYSSSGQLYCVYFQCYEILDE